MIHLLQMKGNVDITTYKVMKKTCEELGITMQEGSKMYDHMLKTMKRILSNTNVADRNSFPTIYLQNFGTFYPIERRIKDRQDAMVRRGEPIISPHRYIDASTGHLKKEIINGEYNPYEK